MLIPSVEVFLAIFISKTVTTMLRHYDQDERESDGSRHWEGIKSVFLRKFARDGVLIIFVLHMTSQHVLTCVRLG